MGASSRSLLCIGGSRLQLPALRWAREAGLEVVLTDVDPEAPGRRLAQRFHRVSGTDVDGLVDLARKLDLAGAYCSNDFGLEAVAAIAAATGTPGNPVDAVRRALDKACASAIWHAAGVATPRGLLVRDADELVEELDVLGLPAIVKPADSSGSRGVRSVRAADEAAGAFAAARRHSERVLVEERVDGRHLDVNAFFRDGAFVAGGILERFFTAPPVHVPLWGVQPAEIDAADEAAVYDLVERAARALELTVGPIKADVVLTGNGPVVLELAPRFHGDVSTAHVTPLALGKSPVQAWFATLAEAGGPFDEMPCEDAGREGGKAGWMALLPPQPGVLAGVKGVEQALRMPGVTDVCLLRRSGHEIRSLDDNTAVVGFLWATGVDAREVEERLRAGHARLKVEIRCRSAA